MGDFLKAYLEVSDPVMIYGYPITEAYQERTQGKIVQYFERARFELFPEGPEELRVKVTDLGTLLYQPGPTLPIPENVPGCRRYETGFRVCYAFLEFYESNGGPAQFGFPISNFELHDGRITQYFQRARFEWHPEMPKGQRVMLTDLGRRYFDTLGEDPNRLLPAPWSAPGSNLPQPILNLKVRSFSQSAVLPSNAKQTLFVIVQDQNLLPVSNAQVTLVIKLPSGYLERVVVPELTDKLGIVRYTFTFNDEPTGVAEVFVSVTFEALEAQTVTSFRIWR